MLFANPAPDNVEEHVLTRRAIGGDDHAARVLLRRLMPVICARVRRALARDGRQLADSDADDLAQEIWVKLIEDGGKALLAFDPARSESFEGYVGMISEREIGNRLRAASAKKRGGHLHAIDAQRELRSQDPSPEENAQAGNLAVRLGEHLEKELPVRGQLVFRYAFTDQLAPEEVAKILGVTVQVVYNWQHKIRAAAKAFFGTA